jgi:outer membrane receptor protein involved in Fe transport
MHDRSGFFTKLLPFIAAVLIFHLAPTTTEAQSTDAAVFGTVKDATGAVVPGATITATNEGTGFSRSAVTGPEGRYRVRALNPGTYTLVMELDGFKTMTMTGIILQLGQEAPISFDAELATVAETVTVTGESPLVEITKAEISGVVAQDQIDSLPLNSRQYLNLALLMPGTSQDGARPYYNNINISSGGTFYSSAFIADGMVNTWAEQGEPRQDLPQDAVEEFKVINTQAKAEYGLATAGVITVVTKSGTNDIHGNVFWYYRNQTLNQNNFFNRELGIAEPDFFRHQFGGSVGGAIVKDKSHIYVAFERTDQEAAFTVNTGGVFPEFDGAFPREFWRNLFSVRWDQTISDEHNLFARYAQEDELTGCFRCGGIRRQNAGFDNQVPRKALVVGLTSIFSAQALNEFKFQRAYSEYQIAPSGTPIFTKVDEFPPERLANIQRVIIRPNVRDGGNFDELGPEHRWEFRDDFTYFKSDWGGDHNFKMGADFSHIPFEDSSAQNFDGGNYTFATNDPYDPNDPSTFPIVFTNRLPPSYTRVDSQHLALYFQDDWSPNEKLTFNLGIRYDRQYGSFNENLDINDYPILGGQIPAVPPDVVAALESIVLPIPFQPDPKTRGDKNNFGPRFGFAYDPSGDARMVIRGGYGIYYDNIRTLANFFEWRNFSRLSLRISNPPFPDPYGGRDQLEFITSGVQNVGFLAQDFHNPQSHQVNFGFEKEIVPGFAFNADFLYTRTRDDRKTVDLNPRDPITRLRPIPEFGRIDEVQSISQTDYRGLYVRLDRRFKNNYQYLVSYTWQSGKDNVPGRRFVNQEPSRREDDYGNFTIDRRHMLVASGFVILPYDIGLSGIYTFRTSMPFSAKAGRDLNGDGFATGTDGDYVPGTTRNQGNRDLDLSLVNDWRALNGFGPIPADQIDSTRYLNLDLRMSKQFQVGGGAAVELMFQVFNVFDNLNLGARFLTPPNVQNSLSPSFGRILSAQDARQAEIAFRFLW